MSFIEQIWDKMNGIDVKKDRDLFNRTGSTETLLQIAEELRQRGDSSAIVIHEKPSLGTHTYLSLRANLQHKTGVDRWDFSDTWWRSQKVVIEAAGEGINVCWEERLSSPTVYSLTNQGAEYSQLHGLTLREQVLLALSLAPPVSDYRYGRASENRLVEIPEKESR